MQRLHHVVTVEPGQQEKKFRHGFSVVDGHWADQENRNFEMAKWRCMDQIFWKGVLVALLDPILPVCL